MCFLALLAACTPEPTGVPEDHGGPAAGSYHEREIAAGEVHVDRWKLAPERFVRGAVIEVDADLVVTAHGPDGRVLTRADGPAGAGMDETFAFTTGGAGEYRLEIRPKGETGGRYDLDLVELRPARRGDEERVAAWRAFQAARHQWALRPYGDPVVEASFRDVLALFEAVGDRSGEAAALQQIGWLQPTPAGELEYYEEALERLDGGGEPGLRGGILADAATAWGERGDLERAVARYREVVALWESLPGRTGDLAKTLSSLGLTLEDLSRHADAREALERALVLGRRVGDQVTQVNVLIGLGLLEQEVGNHLAAIKYLEEARQQALDVGSRHKASRALLYTAAPHLSLGDLQEAWRRFQEAGRELSAGRPTSADERRLEQESAQVWLALGDPERAKSAAERAVELARSQPGRPHVLATALLALAKAELAQGEVKAARRQFEEALTAAQESSQLDIIGQCQLGIARALHRSDRLDEARRVLLELRRERERHGRFDLHLFGLLELAEVELARRDLSASERVLEEAERLVADSGLPDPEANVRTVRARLERERGKPRKALLEIRQAIKLYEALRGRLDSSDLRSLTLARRLSSYDLETDLLLELGRNEEALASAEDSRARSLLELLDWAQQGEGAASVRSDRLLVAQDYNRLSREMGAALLREEPDARLAVLRRELERARRELEELEHERLTPPIASEPFDLAWLRSLLEPGEALLQYHLGAERSALFLVVRDGLSVYPLRRTGDLEALVDGVLDRLQRRSRLVTQLAEDSRRLYGDLIGPVESRLEQAGVRHLVVVPDGNLVYLPWEVLRPGPDEYLLSRWAVSYAPSARVWGRLAELRRPSRGSIELAAFAYPAGSPSTGEYLESVHEEVSDVAALYPREARREFVDEEATEAAFLGPETRRARVIHVAGHGKIDQRQPAFSGLQLAPSPGGDDDGLVQMHEIFALGESFSAELVVLSACDTGLGRRIRGEGLVGLSRAFFYAGVPLLTASLWKVADSSTATLMTEFHRRMRRGEPPVEALRQAKLGLLRNPSFDPYLWAPFVMIGHAEPPPTPEVP